MAIRHLIAHPGSCSTTHRVLSGRLLRGSINLRSSTMYWLLYVPITQCSWYCYCVLYKHLSCTVKHNQTNPCRWLPTSWQCVPSAKPAVHRGLPVSILSDQRHH